MRPIVEALGLAASGSLQRRFRERHRVDESLPWGSLAGADLAVEVVEVARQSFASGAESELMTAIGFSELASALLTSKAPMDLVGLASCFVGDEVLHAELNARLALELGANESSFVRADASFEVDPDLSPLDRALDLALRVSCVGEALSVPLLGLAARSATHPLVRGVLRRIVRDEPPHAELGFHVFEWAKDHLTHSRRARLGRVLTRELVRFTDYFEPRADPPESLRLGFLEVGFARADVYARAAENALAQRVLGPLAAFGIAVDGHWGTAA